MWEESLHIGRSECGCDGACLFWGLLSGLCSWPLRRSYSADSLLGRRYTWQRKHDTDVLKRAHSHLRRPVRRWRSGRRAQLLEHSGLLELMLSAIASHEGQSKAWDAVWHGTERRQTFSFTARGAMRRPLDPPRRGRRQLGWVDDDGLVVFADAVRKREKHVAKRA